MTFPEASPRIERIKKRLCLIKPRLCSERARLVTESYRETEGELAVTRRAKALDKILRQMSIYISDDELIVGNQASEPLAAPLFPEVAVTWIEQDLPTFETRTQDPFMVPTEVKEELARLFPYWKGKTTRAKLYKRLPESITSAIETGVIRFKEASGIGHQLIDFPKVLNVGFDGIKEEAAQKLAQVDLTKPAAYQKWAFWQAVIIVCDAVIAFARRYAEEAKKLASTETGERRKELNRIAAICQRVPAEPAETFHEALQVVWFLTAIAHICQNGTGITIGRLDQFLYPYYKKDIETGRITKGEAQELLDCLWLKLQELNVVRSTEAAPIWPGYEMNVTINIGGQTNTGEDATNELTYMCLDAEAHVHMRRPQLILRVHEGTPDDLWEKAVKVIKLGGGRPELVSDRTMAQALVQLGVPANQVLDYAIIGCAEPVVMGARILLAWSWVSLPKVLELALNDGVDPRTGKRIGLATGNPLTFASYDDMLEAFREQLRYFVSLCAVAINGIIDPLVAEELPHVFFSAITPDCIEKGLDITAGGARYDWSAVWPIGPVTVGNSLAAIKKLVFEDKQLTMAELKKALDMNFEGQEKIRQMLIHAPKFGNDDDYADAITRDIVEMFYDELEKYRTARGGNFTCGYISVGINVAYGALVGATPDGRRSGEPLSDGMSPAQGTEMHGPTASLRSVAKLDLVRAGSGGILNQKFDPAILKSKRDVHKFIDLNKTFLNDLGGMQVQYNVVSAETLRDAQRHPERYPDLLVRVVGYSAYFTELSKRVQDDIIARTEHTGF